MAEAAVEQTQTWLLASEAFPEAEEIARTRFAEFVGSVAMRGCQAQVTSIETESTLLSAIRQAKEGEAQGERVVRNNVATDVAERLYKAGHQTRVYLETGSEGLQQEGQLLRSIHQNTLEHTVLIPEMASRTKQELRNVLLIEALEPTGALDEFDVVFFSPSSTDMSIKQKEDYNFFLETETCSIQYFSKQGSTLELQTAFVAGKETPDSERHDIESIKAVAKQHGTTIKDVSSTGILQHVMLVKKGRLPNQVTGVVEAYDDVSGGTFYGEAKPRQDYTIHAQECLDRAGQFEDIVDKVTAGLKAELGNLRSPLDAIMKLDELSEEHCVKHAVGNKEINVAIFGPTAALHIEEARFFLEQGEYSRAEDSIVRAQATANSGSCPLFKGGSENGESEGSSADEDKHGSLKFKCSNGHTNFRPHGRLIENCQICRISVKC